MGQEIEKKFLVRGDFKAAGQKSIRITQGYLCSVPERTVRVRVKGDKGYITVKGKSNDSGASRFEWEKEIPVENARELLTLCEPGVIDKTRYLIPEGGHVFEVDEFHGDNEGLVIAEVELGSEDEPFGRPSWLSTEVTGDKRYYNSFLAGHPYKTW